jgi:alkanesulfonate monooxygenase SsuD/methylene tetrahydromethanopterin reductase-like flavin-dependent oxidoreductase (luciferase family)
MSGGRLDLGIAAGYRPEEFRGFGVPLAERSARTREGLEILSVALHGDEFSYEGRFHHYDRARVSPEPVQQPIPMWVGGRSAGPLRRAAHDGYHLQLADFDPVQCAADHAVYTQALLDEGRDPAEHEIAAVASIFVHATPARARELAEPHMRYQQDQYSRWFAAAADRPSLTPSDTELPPGCLAGTPSEVLAQILDAHGKVPFTHFSFWTLLPGMDPDLAGASLELFANEVLPALHEA